MEEAVASSGVRGYAESMSNPHHPRTDLEVMAPAAPADMFDRAFWAVFLAIATLGIDIPLVIFEHNYLPRIYRHSKHVAIVQIGDSELEFDHREGVFTIWWQSGRRNLNVWPR
ncbi:MAG: hypothetical protein WBH57_03920 [Anaerolineae bacterium]